MASVDVTRIASNIQALNALNSLQGINAKLAMHQQRLSTGKRINSASDDPAGLTIATKMMARSEGLKASIDNISDAKNMLSVAEGGLSTMTDIMIAMRSMAEKAASDTLGNSERATIQTQLSSYSQQLQDLVDQTKWNGVKLLDNTMGTKTFQTGVDEGEVTTWSLPNALDPGVTGLNLSKKVLAATVTSGAITATYTAIASQTGTTGTFSELTTGDYSFNTLDKATSATQGKVNLDVNSTLIAGMTSFSNSTAASLSAGANVMTSGTYTLKINATTSATSTDYTITKVGDTSFGTNGSIAVTAANLTASTGNLLDAAGGAILGVNIGAASMATLGTNQTMTFEYIAKGDTKYQLTDSTGVALQVAQNGAAGRTGTTAYSNAVAGAGIAINTGRGVTTTLGAWAANLIGAKQSVLYERANLYSVNVSNSTRGGNYLTTVTGALDKVTSALSDLGALMARLTYKEEQSATAQVNIEGAYSRIMNANMAEEQLNASKYTILQQTATAMLAQANAAPQSLLALFR